MRKEMKMSRKKIAVLLPVALLVAACGNGQKDDAAGSADGSDPVTVAVSIYGQGMAPWTDSYGKRLEELAPELKKEGTELLVSWADGTAQGQAAQINSLLAQSPDAVAIYPLNSQATIPSFLRIQQAGASPVQAVIPPVDEATHLIDAYIGGADEVATARAVAQAFVKNIASEGKIAILRGPAGGSDNILRAQGFMEGIAGSNLEVVEDINTDWGDQQKIHTDVSAVLQRHPDIVGLLTQYDGISIGARKAVDDANLDHEVHIANVVGGSCAGLELLKTGGISLVAWHDAWTAAEETARLLPAIARGEDVPANSFMEDPIVTTEDVGDRPCHS
jgi:ribose transport system substrate-binding protein